MTVFAVFIADPRTVAGIVVIARAIGITHGVTIVAFIIAADLPAMIAALRTAGGDIGLIGAARTARGERPGACQDRKRDHDRMVGTLDTHFSHSSDCTALQDNGYANQSSRRVLGDGVIILGQGGMNRHTAAAASALNMQRLLVRIEHRFVQHLG
ncbi:MAG: hypothetical protein KGR48_05695, partial [Alphaproteobacteria bacterium]|nr:hypothetical protein [Alphaproteobacteria bacterium]